MSEYQLFINGEYRAAESGKTAESLSPATGEVFAVVHQAGAVDAQKVLDDAHIDYAVNTEAFSNFFHQGQVWWMSRRSRDSSSILFSCRHRPVS